MMRHDDFTVNLATSRRGGLLGVALALAFLAASPAAGVLVDDFATPTVPVTIADPGVSSTTDAGGIGGEREATITRLAGAGTMSATIGNNALSFTAPPNTRGELELLYDGVGSPGLGGADLTAAGANALRVRVDTLGPAGAELKVAVTDTTGRRSVAGRLLPAVAGATDFFFSFAQDFLPGPTGAADFADADDITVTLRLDGGGAGENLGTSLIDTLAWVPVLGATLDDLDTLDVKIGTTPVTPGGTIRYRMVITNTGGEAVAVDVNEMLDPETGSPTAIRTTPVAFDDNYLAIGNVELTVPVPGVLANDRDPDDNDAPPSTLMVTAFDAQSARSAVPNVTVNPDGSFTYGPPPGFTGVDSFGYSATDDDGVTAMATVTVVIEGLVWFVDDNHCGPPPCGSGTLTDPFGSFHPTQLGGIEGAGDVDAPGDVIYVRTGSGATDTGGPAGFELEDGQQLLGEGVALVVNGQTIVPAGVVRPRLTNLDSDGGGPDVGGDGLTLAMDNTIRGLNLGDVPPSSTRLTCTNVGTLTISEVAVGSTGGVIAVSGGTLDVTFDKILSTASDDFPAILLDSVGGTFTVLNPGAGLDTEISGADDGIAITNSVAGASFSFGETSVITKPPVSGFGDGVFLDTNAGATIAFDSLDVTTADGIALCAFSSGIVTIGGTANTINATGGEAVEVSNTSVGAGWTFDSVSSVNSVPSVFLDGDGIDLVGVTGSGPTQITVTGTTTLTNPASSCLEIENAGSHTFGTVNCSSPGGDGLELKTVSGAVQFGATTISDPGQSGFGDGVDVEDTTPTGSVTFLSTLAVDGVAGAGDNGIELRNNVGSFTVTGTTTLGAATGNDSHDVFVMGGTGPVTFAAVDVDNRGGHGVRIDSTGGTINFGATTIDNQQNTALASVSVSGTTGGSVTFASLTSDNNGLAEGVLAAGNAAPLAINGGAINDTAGDGVNSVNTPLTVSGVSFGNLAATMIGGDAIEVVNSDATARSASLTGNTMSATGGVAGRGIFLNASGSGPLTATVSTNNVVSASHALETADGGAAGALSAVVNMNVFEATAGGGFGVRMIGTAGAPSTTVTSFSGNTVTGNGVGGGMTFSRVVFDAGGGTQVMAGVNNIGQGPAARVAGDGLELLGPSGDLGFATLNVFNSGGTGVEVNTKAAPPTVFNLATGSGTVDTTGGPALNLDPLSLAATLTAAISSASPGAGAIFDAVSGTVSVPTIDIDGSTGNGLTIKDSSATFTLTTVNVDGTTGAGVFLNNNTGVVNINGGAIGGTNDPAGNAVDVDGGNADVTIAASVTKSSAGGEVVEVTGRTGGTITFSQQITCNSGCTGLNFSGNTGGSTTFSHTTKTVNSGANAALTVASSSAHAISFTNGGLDIDTTSGNGIDVSAGGTINITGGTNTITTTSTGKGFEADGGGTLTVTGNARIDTTAGTGVGVDIQNTTIGATGVTFFSVNVDGASNGIVLNTTGSSGGLAVTGDGTLTRNASGGTIQNTTGDAVSLTDTQDFSATSLDVTNPGTAAGDQHGINATNLRGSSNLVRASRFSGVSDPTGDAIRVRNTNVNLGMLEVNDSLFTGVNATGNDGVFFEMLGTSQGRLDVTNNSHFDGLRGDGVQAQADGTGTVTVNVLNSRFSNDSGIQTGGIGGFAASRLTLRALDSALAAGGTIDATIQNNVFDDAGVQAGALPVGLVGVIDVIGDQFGSVTARIIGNTIQDIEEDGAIRIIADDSSSGTYLVDGNTVSSVLEPAVFFQARDTAGITHLTVQNNNFGGGPDGLPGGGDDLPVGSDLANFHEDTVRILVQETAATSHIKVLNNTMVNNSSSQALDLDSEDSAVVNLTIHNNRMTNLGNNGEAMDIEADNGGSICLDLNGDNVAGNRNTFQQGGGAPEAEVVIDLENDGGTYQIEDLTGGTNAAAVDTFLTARNNLNNNLLVEDGGLAFSSVAECTEPNLPP